MAEIKSEGGVPPVTFFSVVVQVFISMTLVLQASARPEGDWFRTFVMIYLTAMVVLYTVTMLVLRKRKGIQGKPAGDGAAQS